MSVNLSGNLIHSYLSEVALPLVFGVGYYIFNSFNKKETSQKITKKTMQTAKTLEQFHEVIRSCEISDPISFLNEINKAGIIPTIETYNELLLFCFRTEDFESSDQLIEEIMDPLGPVLPNNATLSILIRGLNLKFQHESQTSQLTFFHFDQKLLELIASMEQREIFLDINSHNTILIVLVEQQRLNEAWSQFQNMKSCVSANLVSFNTILTAISNSNKIKNSPEWLNNIYSIYNEATVVLRENKDSYFYNALLSCLIKGNFLEKEKENISEIMKEIESPTQETLVLMLTFYTKTLQVEKVEETYTQLNKLEESICNLVLDCYAKTNEEARALKVFSDMKRFGLTINHITFGLLIKLCCNGGNYNKAFELFDECVGNGIKPTVVIYQMLIKLQLKNKFIDRGITLFRNMLVNGIQADKMISELIIPACCEHKRINEAAEFLFIALDNRIKLEKFIYEKVVDGILSCDQMRPYEKLELTERLKKFINDKTLNDKLEIVILSANLAPVNNKAFNNTRHNQFDPDTKFSLSKGNGKQKSKRTHRNWETEERSIYV